MSDIDLQKFEQRIADALLKAQVTDCEQLLKLSDCSLLKLENICIDDLNKIRSVAAESVAPLQFVPVSRLRSSEEYRKWDRLTVGCPRLDALLLGGIPRRGITELTGESGSGKTQLCLQLTIGVQLPRDRGGYNAGAAYICTEEKFPSTRLHQLFETSPLAKLITKQDCSSVTTLGQNIFIQHVADVDGLINCVDKTLPCLLAKERGDGKQHVGLIVIDSITAVFRGEYESSGDIKMRAQHLRSIGVQLYRLARQYNVSVVCINQVNSGANNRLVPALGLAWSNLVTTRLQMTRLPPNRYFQVVFAPDLPSNSVCSYKISACGIFGES